MTEGIRRNNRRSVRNRAVFICNQPGNGTAAIRRQYSSEQHQQKDENQLMYIFRIEDGI
ncbi:hypothetical protein SB48_HM08orf05568 [Heyndrickxia coagulans]|uniref:Uncharacterized protein n=1 Tax=Heyndrickxia coagulans TaxID=1398 RepID=A0AAN0T9R1_HEYCO|nr:hypothetical protein SB48_HM08orf05568 [Heyndrickxia coagulans]